MKSVILALLLVIPLVLFAEEAKPLPANAPLVYVNKNLGFNVKNYKYKQSQFPCDVDKVLVSELVDRSQIEGIRLEPVATIEKIRNGVIPVLAIDVEQLVFDSKGHQFGANSQSGLPKVQITAALVKGNQMVTAKHTCAIMSLNEFTPSGDVTDLGSTSVTVCSAMNKCLHDLSKDVVEWYAPLLNK